MNDEMEPTRSLRESDAPRAPWPDRTIPEQVDGFRIVRMLGQGGMGSVYEAEQQEPRRRVALKVVRAGAQADDLDVRLFRREVETLARLRHPNIAAIYGSGRLPDGRPYFAMELVEGPTLDKYVQGRPSPSQRGELEHRLALMRRIAGAVHYAHQRGVIHRDLKPSNIIVTEGFDTSSGARPPEVKILDFGLARITDEEPAASLMSEAGTIRGTLPYMSPEQARGDAADLDVRSDVYALGVLLYELIAGQRPYDVQRAALVEAIRIIGEEPPRPLRGTASGVHRVDGDLETIVFKALAKEPDRRYSSAAALVDDLERYVASQPILARPASAAYQLRKLVQRHKAAVGALAAVLLVVVAASIVSTALFVRARTEAAKATQVSAFLSDMLTGVGPSVARGRDTALLREVLERTKQRLDGELAGQPEVAASIHQVLGLTYRELGALDTAEVHLNAALATNRRLHRGDHPAIADNLAGLGNVCWARDEFAQAESLFRDVLGMRRRLNREAHPQLAEAVTDLGNVLVSLGRLDEAEPLLREGLEMRTKLLGAEGEGVAVSLNSLANLLHHRGQLDAADSLHRQALALHTKLYGPLHPHTLADVTNLGMLFVDKGAFAAAESTLLEAVERNRQVFGPEHLHVAYALRALGNARRRLGNFAGAEATMRESYEIVRRASGDGTAPVAGALLSLAVAVSETRGAAASLPLYREALAIHRRVSAPDGPDVASSALNLAMALGYLREFDEADSLFREAVPAYVRLKGEHHPEALLARNNYARMLLTRGDVVTAEREFRQVLEGRRAVLGEWADQTGISMGDVAAALRAQGRYAESDSMYGRAIAVLDSSLGPAHAATVITRMSRTRVRCYAGRGAMEEPAARAARDAIAGIYGPGHERTLAADIVLAMALFEARRPAEAEPLLRAALAAPPAAIQPPVRIEAQLWLGKLLARGGRHAEAERVLLAGEALGRDQAGLLAQMHRHVLDELVALYEGWPGGTQAAKAARWRAARAGTKPA